MIAQTAESLRKRAPKLGKYGCYFMCLAYLGWAARPPRGAYLSLLDMIVGYHFAQAKGWCDEDCYVTNPEAIANYFARWEAWEFLGWGAAEIETPPMPWGKGTEVPIYRYEWNGKSHFLLAGYDPMVSTSLTASNGHIASTRLLRRR